MTQYLFEVLSLNKNLWGIVLLTYVISRVLPERNFLVSLTDDYQPEES